MCTCITYYNHDFYFGRNLDLDCSFREKILITPRNFQLNYRKVSFRKRHYTMIGMASAVKEFPYHRMHLNHYLNLSAKNPRNRFSDDLNLIPCSQGMGAVGLPGDASSSSWFIMAAF